MGRGLSDLQKTILAMAYEGHVRQGITPPVKNDNDYEDSQGLDVTQSEILVKLFDFKVKYHYRVDDNERIVIDKTSTGEKRYNTGRATLSRALKRLEDRGLILRWYVFTEWWPHYSNPSDLFETIMGAYQKTSDYRGTQDSLTEYFFLAYKSYSGLRLTQKGVETAKKLSVNTFL